MRTCISAQESESIRVFGYRDKFMCSKCVSVMAMCSCACVVLCVSMCVHVPSMCASMRLSEREGCMLVLDLENLGLSHSFII